MERRGVSAGALIAATASGSLYSPEAATLFAAMTGEPDATRKGVIDTLIRSLKSAGVWTLNGVLYLTAAHDSQAAGLNWKLPGTNTLTPVNAPSFVADRGYTGNGTNTKLLPGFASRDVIPGYSQDSAHASFWSRTDLNTNTADVGTGTSGQLFLVPRSAGNFNSRINNSTSISVAVADSLGHFLVTRRASTDAESYKDGASVQTSAAASSSITGADEVEFLTATAVSGFSSRQDAMFSLGSGMTDAQVTAFYDALLVYMQAVGAA